MLTAERLREVLDYNPLTGVFLWRVDCVSGHGRIHVRAGSAAGWKDKNGHMMIGVDGRSYFAHRLAWLHKTGEWPSRSIDHRNLNKSDNRWSNLRQASHAQNGWNKGVRRDSATGFKGVSFHRRDRLFCARIKIGEKRIGLGYFKTAEAAHAAYAAAAQKHFGEFARAA